MRRVHIIVDVDQGWVFLVDFYQGCVFLVDVVNHTWGGMGIPYKCQPSLAFFVVVNHTWREQASLVDSTKVGHIMNIANLIWGGIGIPCRYQQRLGILYSC